MVSLHSLKGPQRRYFSHRPPAAANGTFSDGNFQACSSPEQWSALADGPYTFYVTAIDRVGNSAEMLQSAFLVDTIPPMIANISLPLATRAANVTAVFAVTDGPLGSGIADVQCR